MAFDIPVRIGHKDKPFGVLLLIGGQMVGPTGATFRDEKGIERDIDEMLKNEYINYVILGRALKEMDKNLTADDALNEHMKGVAPYKPQRETYLK